MNTDRRRDFSAILLILGALLVLPLGIGHSRYLMSVLMNCAGVAVIASGVWLTFCIGRNLKLKPIP